MVSLTSLLRTFQELAPLELAEPWDNVGLLVDPRRRAADVEIERVVLTIDATQAVLRDAALGPGACLFAYHPPLFKPVRRVSLSREPALFEALSRGFPIYSPHTALDAAPGGLNDWLAQAFAASDVRPIVPSTTSDSNAELKLVVFVPAEHADTLRDALADAGAGLIGNYSRCSFNLAGEGTFHGGAGANPVVGEAGRLERAPELRLEMVCGRAALARIARAIARHHPYEEPAWDVYPLELKRSADAGAGRLVTLAEPASLDSLVFTVKAHLGIPALRLAASERHASGAPISRIAVAAGSGASVFEHEPGADLYLTGELRHHDVLAKLATGASVLLCEHSSSERGYLPRLRERLTSLTAGRLDVRIAQADVEPLRVV